MVRTAIRVLHHTSVVCNYSIKPRLIIIMLMVKTDIVGDRSLIFFFGRCIIIITMS